MGKEINPIVIPPLVCDKFTCLGKGLLYEGHARESTEALKVLLLPPGGAVAITDRSRPKMWWTAQAVFYDLPSPKTSNITQIRKLLEDRLRTSSLKLSESTRKLESKANSDFKKLNKQILDKTGLTKASTPTKGAGMPSKQPPTSLKKHKHTAPTKSTSKGTGSAATSGKKTTPAPKVLPTQERPVTAAIKRSATEDFQPDPFAQPTKRAKLTADHETKHEEPDSPTSQSNWFSHEIHEFKEPLSHSSPSRSPSPPRPKGQPPTDVVSGRWRIKCPYIATEWPSITEQNCFSLNIVRTHGRKQIEGAFRFGLVD
ncbi:hypothetical protein FRB99_003870, partial [Tulasnella sp. 403]